jgi:hypothetical protein
MKSFKHILVFSILFFMSANILAQTTVMIGPRVTGNFNIYNAKGDSRAWNGIGVGFGGTVDVTFGKRIGMMVNLTAFDMRSISSSRTSNNITEEWSVGLSYLTIDPMFKLEFNGFYMVTGPSLGIKLSASGDYTQTQTGATPQSQTFETEAKTVRFDITVGTGYTFKLSPDMGLGTDFFVYIPLSNTFNIVGVSNSILSLKLGVSLKFKL